jgi:GNAT superfamily N-acetyltransferase
MRASTTLVLSLAPSELKRIALVWHEALGSMQRASPLPSANALLQRLTGDLARCHIAVARNGREIVAFVAYDPDQRWLRQLFVHPASQGLGIGTRLLATAMRAMPDGWLRTDETNAHARRFYLDRGLRVRRIGPHPSTGAPTIEFEWP